MAASSPDPSESSSHPSSQRPQRIPPWRREPRAADPSSLVQAVDLLQQRIDQLQANLAQQNKLATLGMVTAVLAHEFNNILTPMISYTKFALTANADEALRTKALAKALSGAQRLAGISQSLLGFARGDQSTTANVAHAIKETLACLSRDLAKDGITLTEEIPADLVVAMNAGQLQQVLMNLVVNARSAMLGPKRGAAGGLKRLTIRAQVAAGGSGTAGKAEIRVEDTGPGIAADVLPRIFEPFFSTKHSAAAESSANTPEEPLPRGGTGLGLTICRELVVGAGGSIRVESVAGQGATFIVELPVARGNDGN